MPTRRSIIAGSAAAAAAPLAIAASPIPKPPTVRAHSIPGGAGGIVAARYGLTATGAVNGLGTVTVPVADKVCLLPFGVIEFDESSGSLFTLDSQMVTIAQTGRYRITLSVDWGARYNTDIDLREYGIQRMQVADPTFTIAPLPKITVIGIDKWDRLADYDVPGSDSPVNARSAAGTQWNPGTVQPGDYVYADVPVTPTGLVAPGDAAQVGLSTLTSAVLGAAADRLRLFARVDAPDVVRVVLQNLGTDPVTVPQGALNVLGQSLVNYRGRSTDGWLTVQTADEVLYAGEKIFCFFRSKMPGDFVQVSNESFLQIEKIG
jgi:hypothetical protein